MRHIVAVGAEGVAGRIDVHAAAAAVAEKALAAASPDADREPLPSTAA